VAEGVRVENRWHWRGISKAIGDFSSLKECLSVINQYSNEHFNDAEHSNADWQPEIVYLHEPISRDEDQLSIQ
jgi:hypothetical protein